MIVISCSSLITVLAIIHKRKCQRKRVTFQWFTPSVADRFVINTEAINIFLSCISWLILQWGNSGTQVTFLENLREAFDEFPILTDQSERARTLPNVVTSTTGTDVILTRKFTCTTKLIIIFLHFFLCFSVNIVEDKSSEDAHDTKPLASDQWISKQENRPKNGEEFPRGGDNGACQRSKVSHSDEDEILQRNKKKKVKKQSNTSAVSFLTHWCTSMIDLVEC